ncbi:hypothetical protein GCM10010359_10530 [Streptomyces morookaense]|nr:hypothetical protein GCM10010359_10530 [Streptomyces morookaense]
MDGATGGLGLEPGAQEHIQSGGIAEFELRAVDDDTESTFLDTGVEEFTQQIRRMVIELTRGRQDRHSSEMPELDFQPTPARTAGFTAVHAHPFVVCRA